MPYEEMLGCKAWKKKKQKTEKEGRYLDNSLNLVLLELVILL